MLRLEFICNGKYYPDIDALSASEEAQKNFGNMITGLRHYNPKKNRVCPPGEIFGLDKSYREKLASLKRELIRTDAKLRLHVTTDPTRPEGYRHHIEFPECRPELAEKISALLD